MAPDLIEVSFEIPPLERLVLDDSNQPAKDNTGQLYISSRSHRLQAVNQQTLWEHFLRSRLVIPDGAILDAGGGDGLFFALASYMVFNRDNIGRRTVILLDKEKNKVRRAREVAELVKRNFARQTTSDQRPQGYSLTCIVLDSQDLAQMDTQYMIINGQKERGFPKVALVWSNSMFHWIKEPGDKYAALNNMNAVLQRGGILCMSMSAGGTARDFLRAYNKVFAELGVYDSISNPKGFLRAQFEDDPIGSRPLDEIVNMLEDSGFDVRRAVTFRESATYQHPREYADTVGVYGRDSFLRAVPHYGEKKKRTLWAKIVEEFLLTLAKKGWTEGQPYTYWQYNNYLIAIKRSAITTQEKRIPNFMPASYLNRTFLQHGYEDSILQRRGIKIQVSGDEEQIKDRETVVDIADIVRKVLIYTSREWVENDVSPICHIKYNVLNGNQLKLQFEVKTIHEMDFGKEFPAKALSRLQEQGVNMDSKFEGGVRIYEFRIPLLSI
ncbi:class I SAM-dependent methyltransferase [Candidatus Woesearchaeota archaeon]|nr:class I SAM-dependent methyltransferase [Candidatus Woesearchaeota archaeon]